MSNDFLLKASLWITKPRSMIFHIIVSIFTAFIWTLLYFLAKNYLSKLEMNPTEEYKQYINNKEAAVIRNMESKKIHCPNCKSDNVSVQMVSEQQRRGCLTVLLYIFLACTIIGLILLIPLLRGQKSKTNKYYVCQNCGHSWGK